MSAPIQSVTTSATGLNRLWRKVQGTLQTGFQFMCEEWNWLDRLQEFKIDWSFREITFPVDLTRGVGSTSMVEGGWEGRPSSPNVDECTINWIHLNKRFNASMMAMWVSQNNPAAALADQLVFQGKKALQTLAADFSDKFHGYSNSTLALTNSDLTSGATQVVLTLTSVYGDTNVTANTNVPASVWNAFLVDKFPIGERVALLLAGSDALVATNAIGTVSASSRANGTITVDLIGALGANVTADGIRIVKFNSIDPTNAVASSDVNKGLLGMQEQLFAASVQGLSTSTQPNWRSALNDTTGGRFNGSRLQRMRDEVANTGGGTVDTAIMAQGVKRDLFLQYQAGVRYASPAGIEIDGDVKASGMTFLTGRRVIPGTITVFDKSNSIKKGTLLRKPSKGPNWGDGRKLENQSAMVFQMDFPVFLANTCRGNMATAGNLVESY
jgi:hypothetical protein